MEAIRLAFVFSIGLISVFAAEEKPDIYTQAATCPHRYHMGCMLDVIEKSCTGLQTIEACANKGKCKNVDELQRLVGALDPKNFEALNKCCCTKAIKDGGYEDCKNPDPVCKKAIADHVGKDLAKHLAILNKCFKKPKKSSCKEAIDSAKWTSAAIQKARGEMRTTEGCELLAPSTPISECGWDVKPTPRALSRADLYCDTIIWQFKEMGASDPFMSKCKDAPAMPAQKPEAEEQEENFGEGEEELEETEGEGNADEGENDTKEGSKTDSGDDAYSQAAKCPHRGHMGCMLDVMERSCEATRELSECINGSPCEKREFKSFVSSLDPSGATFLGKCCCSGAAYSNCKKPNTVCADALTSNMPESFEKMYRLIKEYQKKSNKKNAKKALGAVKIMRDSLQKIRGVMRKNTECQMLAPMEPLIECGWNLKEPRPFERSDILCDAMIWQFKELGTYEQTMAECPGAPKVKPEDIPSDGEGEGEEGEGQEGEGEGQEGDEAGQEREGEEGAESSTPREEGAQNSGSSKDEL